MATQLPRINAAADFVSHRWNRRPRAGIVLGSGLGEFHKRIELEVALPYADVPHFPQSTAMGHAGQLLCGTVAGVPVLTMAGRFHGYEGYDPQEVTLPIRVMRQLGVELLILSNASGGLNPAYETGDIMVIEDHINLMFRNPLLGGNEDPLGPRFPDMSAPYDPALVDQALAIARRHDFTAHRGVYASVTGPNYETRAEYRFLRSVGADVVGMSTVPEVIVAVHAGLRVLALSAVTNVFRPESLDTTEGEQVVEAAASAEPQMSCIVADVVSQLAATSAHGMQP